ncbi:hypothetical protein AAF712_015687 [Marasmius tenuissimus]|uniref:Uncharacterized protein n=1 Tax=Marasmius tenuissimus TaxID=585030 RepID=A0ABR2Z9R5_9AGAR
MVYYSRPRCLEHTELVEPPSIITPSTGPQRNTKVHRSSTPPYSHPRNVASPRPSPALTNRSLAIDFSDSSSEDSDDTSLRIPPRSPERDNPIPRHLTSTRSSPEIDPPSQSLDREGSVGENGSEYSLNVPEDAHDDQGVYSGLPKIRKPEGEAGRPKRGGYNLEEKLGWDTRFLSQVKSFVKNEVISKLTCSVPFTSQPSDQLDEIRSLAINQFPLLERYEDCWVVDDLIRCNLKYQKQKIVKEQNDARQRSRDQAREERKALEKVATSSRTKRQI